MAQTVPVLQELAAAVPRPPGPTRSGINAWAGGAHRLTG